MNILFVSLGGIFLFLGLLGVLLPILPTVPFLLLSSWCFMKGDKRLERWIKNTNFYQKYVGDIHLAEGMPLKRKGQILFWATIMIGISILVVNHIHVRIFLMVLLLVKYYVFLFKIKTLEEERE